MTPDREVHDLKAALEQVTPDAPHLAHTVIAAARAAAASPEPRGLTVRQTVVPWAGAALFAVVLIGVLLAHVVPAPARVGTPGAGPTGLPASSARTLTAPGPGYDLTKDDSLLVGAAPSAHEAWIVQWHWPGYFAPGQTFSILYRTEDGGATWVQKLRYPGAYDGMWFSADGRTGVVWGVSKLVPPCTSSCGQAPPVAPGLVYRTTDGGDHWTSSPTPGDLNVYAMYFLDADHGWAVLHPPVGATMTAYATSDGGVTWRRGGVLPAPANVEIETGRGHQLRFSTPSDGVFVPWPDYLFRTWPVLLVTRDGGMTWSRVAVAAAAGVPASAGVEFGAPTILADGTGVLPVSVTTGRPTSPSALYVSTTSDHGQTWTAPRRVYQADGLAARLYVLDGGHWWIAGTPAGAGTGEVRVTADGGRTWTRPVDSPRVLDLVLSGPTVGWAAYEDWSSPETHVALTTDAGAHWEVPALPPAAR